MNNLAQSKLIPMSHFVAHCDQLQQIIAIEQGHEITAHAWFLRYLKARQILAARQWQNIALHCDNALNFSAVFFAGWQLGIDILMPANDLPGVRNQLAGQIDAWIDDSFWSTGVSEASEASEDRTVAAEQFVFDNDPSAFQAGKFKLGLFTSGSSGKPILIKKKLAQLETELQALEQTFGPELGQATVLGTVSHQHIYGLLFRVLWPLLAQRKWVVEKLEFPEHIEAHFSRAPCVLISSPALLKRMPYSLLECKWVKALRLIFSSGGKLPELAAKAINNYLKLTPTEIYGSTETGGIAWRKTLDDDSIWLPLPSVLWRIEAEKLSIQSNFLPDTIWFNTEDMARSAGNGFVLMGRADRIIKLEERRISLSAIERSILEISACSDVRVIAIDGTRLVLGAVIELKQDLPGSNLGNFQTQIIALIRQHLRQHHEAISLPRQWRFVARMPVNEQGKTTQTLLQSMFRREAPRVQSITRERGSVVYELFVEQNLQVLDGHFPNLAVVPGVALLEWVIGFARESFALVGNDIELDALKFQKIVCPPTLLQIEISPPSELSSVSFTVSSMNGKHASGRITFHNEPAAL